MNYKLAVEKFIKELNIKEIEIYKKDYNEQVCLLSGTIDTEKVVLKIFSVHDKRRLNGANKEFLVNQLIDHYNSNFTKDNKKKILKTDILSFDHDNELVWIIRKYFNGQSLCGTQFKSDYLITPDKLGQIREQFLPILDKIVDRIAQKISLFYQIKKTDKFDNGYKKKLVNYSIECIESGLKIDLHKQLGMYNNHYSTYFSVSRQKACLGDLTPANIIILDNLDVLLTDFEWFCFDNLFMDIAYLWLFLWKYPKSQSRWLKIFIKSDLDKNDFVSSIVRILIGQMNNIFSNLSDSRKDIEIIRKTYQSHIWTKYLENAYDFNKLINTKI